MMKRDYQLGLLYLTHLLSNVDGIIDENEHAALLKIIQEEKIPDNIFEQFQLDIQRKSEREIYNEGLDFLNRCTPEEKLRAFSILYKISEVDGSIHVREVRLLLYSTRFTGIEFDEVVKTAKTLHMFSRD